MTWVHQGVVGQAVQLLGKCLVHGARVTAVMAVAHTGVKHGVAGKQSGLIGVRAQADVAHGVARCIQRLQLHRLAHFDDIARRQAACHTGDAVFGFVVGQYSGTGLIHDGLIAIDVVMVLVRIENLGDFPTRLLGSSQALLAVQGIYSQGLAGFGASHQVVEIAVVVTGPNLFYEHRIYSSSFKVCNTERKSAPLKSGRGSSASKGRP